MLTTPLCRRLGMTAPIFSVGMGALAGPTLAAAVSNAGACGVLGRVSGAPAAHLRQQIRQVRALTDKPFGVNIILATLQAEWIDICLDERIPLLVFFWGDPKPYVQEAHRRGIKVFLQVGSVEEARTAAEAGVDAIIAQGLEAGGHVKSTTALSSFLPAVVEAVQPVRVIAAGGLPTAVVSWPRSAWEPRRFRWERAFCAARRRSQNAPTKNGWCRAPPRIRSIPRSSTADGMPRTGCCVTRRSPSGKRRGVRALGDVPGRGPLSGPRLEATHQWRSCAMAASSYPSLGFSGEIDYTVLYAGESCHLIHDIKPAAQIVRDMIREAEEVIERLPRG